MRISLTLFICLSLGLSLMAQSSKKGSFTNSYDIELQNATFDEAFGLMFKANRWWYIGSTTSPKKIRETRVQSSLALHLMAAPGTSPTTTGVLDEFTGRVSLRAHIGVERSFFAKTRGYVFLSAYAGVNSMIITGRLDHSARDFGGAYNSTTIYGDFGSRFGIGYRVTEKLGIQLSVTNSWLHINNPLGVLPGLLFWGPDALALGGIGINYRL